MLWGQDLSAASVQRVPDLLQAQQTRHSCHCVTRAYKERPRLLGGIHVGYLSVGVRHKVAGLTRVVGSIVGMVSQGMVIT